MRVDMAVVNMSGNYGLKASLQQPLGKLHAEPVRLLCRHFAGRKGMDDVITLNQAASLIPAALGFLHIPKGGIELTVDCCLENLAVF